MTKKQTDKDEQERQEILAKIKAAAKIYDSFPEWQKNLLGYTYENQ